MAGVTAFTALADCPKCGSLDIHWLDEPMPKPDSDAILAYEREYQKWSNNPGDRIVAFGGGTVRHVGGYPQPRGLRDESRFEVMRVCVSCKHRWGQA